MPSETSSKKLFNIPKPRYTRRGRRNMQDKNKSNQATEVKGNQATEVKGNQATEVKGNQTTEVKGNQATEAKNSRTRTRPPQTSTGKPKPIPKTRKRMAIPQELSPLTSNPRELPIRNKNVLKMKNVLSAFKGSSGSTT